MEIKNIPKKYFLNSGQMVKVMNAGWKSYSLSRTMWEMRELVHKEYDRINEELSNV